MSKINTVKITSWGPETREKLERLLSGFHIRFTLVENIPFCILPPQLYHFVIPNHSDGERTEECNGCELKSLCPGFPTKRIHNEYVKALKLIPNEVVVEITRDCNRHCKFCHVPIEKGRHLPLSRVKTIISSASSLGVKAIRLTGGEPILHPRIEEILIEANRHGLSTIINSNGTLPDLVRHALKFDIKNILISLNLPYDSKDLHTKIRIMSELRKRLPILRIGSVANRELMENFSKYAEVVSFVNPTVWELYRPMPPEADLSPEIWAKLINLMERFNARNETKVKLANFTPLCWFNWKIFNLSMGNFADRGYSRLVYRSHPIEGFYFDYFDSNLLGHELSAAWESEAAKHRRLLEDIEDDCKRCKFRIICKGKLKSRPF